ncbi:MAG: alkaline phosphatase family protein, partial [Bacteroidales bacterium]|nr:alkaline phosphatase family protein [Bacteroidales bacterium]
MKTQTFLFIIFFGIAATKASAQDPRIPSENPRLIVGIVIEQMRSDYISRFWDKLGEGGFKRLIHEGTYCRNASYNYFHTQTAPGYATVFTGSMPASHGIVADEWYDRVSNKVTQAVSDESAKTTGGSFDAGHYSPRNMLGTTIGDEIKLANLRQSKVFGVSLDPVSAILPAGHMADGAFWLDIENGTWITSSYYMPNLPNWLNEENKKKLADLYLTKTWDTGFPVSQYTNCLTDENPYETGIDGRIVFPYALPDLARGKSISARYLLLKQTPFGNTLTKDMAIAAMVNENLGKDEFTDVLTVSFVSTEYIGNAFGPMSIEVEDAFLKLDKDLEHFLQFVDDFVGKQNVLVFVTSNHGAAQTPAYLADSKAPVGSFNYNSALSLLRSYLNALYGGGEWVKGYFGQQLYLNSDLIENSKMKLEDFREVVAQFLIQFTGVSNTLTATALQNNQYTEGYRSKMQNNFFPRRSGDVFVNLHPGWVEKNRQATSHNSAYLYDAQVPLIWYGWKVKRDMIVRPVDMTDVAPTISSMMNIIAPNAATGKVIAELVK